MESSKRLLGLPITYVAGAVATLLVLGIVFFSVYFSSPGKQRGDKKPVNQSAAANDEDEPLVRAREMLAKANDLDTCRAAIQQINSHLTANASRRPPGLTDADSKRLAALDLQPDEMK